MILAVNTAGETTELILLSTEGKRLAEKRWQAERQLSAQLLDAMKGLLAPLGADWSDLTGIVVMRGPGSFTGLRIGATVANAIAYARRIPIVGTLGGQWITTGLQRLQDGHNDTQVVPEYGAPPRITKPKT